MKHDGDLIAEAGRVYTDITTIGGSLDASGADTKTAFPKLTTIGGSLDASGADTKTAFPKLVSKDDPNAVSICRKTLFEDCLKNGIYYADGIAAKLIKLNGRVARVIIIGKTTASYVVNDGRENYSHGTTLDEARRGLIYKLSSRDTTEFEQWRLDTSVSLADAIRAYRSITGVCESGTRHFCEQKVNIPKKLTVAEVVVLTKGQFGNDTFRDFFRKGTKA